MSENRIGQLREAAGLTLEQLAEAAELSVSYLSRLQAGTRPLSQKNARKIANALHTTEAAVFGYQTTTGVETKAGRLPGFAEDELQPYEPRPSDTIVKPKGLNVYFMTVATDALVNIGLRRGDIVEVDGSAEICRNPPPMAAVRVQWHYEPDDALRAVTLLRQFVPPSKLITNAPNFDAPPLDTERDDAQILGVLTRFHRKLPGL